jgi:hypothetical protein
VARAGLVGDVVRRGGARVFLERSAVPLILGAMASALLFVPGIPTFCPLRLMLHMPCPSCGLTRAARLALVGDWAGAARMHPLCFAVLPYVGFVGVGECATHLCDGSWGSWAGRPAMKRIGAGILVALVAVWIAREIGAFGGPDR